MGLNLEAVKEILHAEVITGHHQLSTEIEAGAGSDLMSDLLTGQNSNTVLLTGLCNAQVIRTAVIAGVMAIVFVRKKRPTADVIELADNHEIPLLTTPFTMFSSCGRLFAKGLRGVEGRDVKITKAP